MTFLRFWALLTTLAVLLFLFILLPLHFSNSVYFILGLYSLFSYYILTLLAYFMSIHGIKSKQTGMFMRYVFGAMFVKLILSIVLILLFLRMFKDQKMEFVLTFLTAYLVFTGFEIYCLMLNLRGKVSKENAKGID